MLAETMSTTETTEMNIDDNKMDQNDEKDQNRFDHVKTNQMFVFDRTNKRKDFQSGLRNRSNSSLIFGFGLYFRLNFRSEIKSYQLRCDSVRVELFKW